MGRFNNSSPSFGIEQTFFLVTTQALVVLLKTVVVEVTIS